MRRIFVGAQTRNESATTVSSSSHHGRGERHAGARAMIGKRLLLHGLVALTAMAGVAAFAAAGAAPSLADAPVHQPITLTLSNGTSNPGQWVATGTGYARGLSDVSIYVYDVTNPSMGFPLLEAQYDLTTSSYSIFPYNPGGLFSAAGQEEKVFLNELGPVHPLQCGHQYEAVTYDPTDGYVQSNVLSEPACSVPAPPA
jgi:hypothetical protein